MTVQQIVDLLNDAFKADPDAIHSLICNNVPANKNLLDHPTIMCSGIGKECKFPKIGLLGLLNGIAQIDNEIIECVFTDKNNDGFAFVTGFRVRAKGDK